MQYGTVHPKLYNAIGNELARNLELMFVLSTGNYSSAVDAAKRQMKFLMLYVHQNGNQECEALCRNALCTEVISSFLDDHFIFYVANLGEFEGNCSIYCLCNDPIVRL